jgi:hypothetical protein
MYIPQKTFPSESADANAKDVLAMFAVYIDDSGTAPDQAVAMASAVIIPAKRIVALDEEWSTFAAKERFTAFHSSECVHRNPKSAFADWDDEKVLRVTARIRQICKKFAVQAFSFAVAKDDYDSTLEPEMKELFGKFHYTWAIQHVLTLCSKWAENADMNIPFEYVFDWMDRSQAKAKAEIEDVMFLFSQRNQKQYSNYCFRHREDVPALQCTDLLAWSSYQVARHHFFDKPLNAIADANYQGFRKFGDEWLSARSITKSNLHTWVEQSVRSRPDHVRRLSDLKRLRRRD